MPRALIRVACGLVAATVLVVAPAADACSCVSSSSCQRFAMSAVVFAGEVVDVTNPTSGREPKLARLKVLRSYKGDAAVGQTVRVSMPPGSSASCSLDVAPGARYVIYGDGKGGQYATSLCDGSYGLRSGDPLPSLPPPAGEVTGRLYRLDAGPGGYDRNGVAGAKVWVGTPAGRIEARTDAQGLFRLTGVPQGPHTVRFDVGPGERAEEEINLRFPGDCAQVFAIPRPLRR